MLKPRTAQAYEGVPVINNSGGVIPAGPVATVGFDATNNRVEIGLPSADALSNGVFTAEYLILQPLNDGEMGMAYHAGEFTPAADLSAASAGDYVWLQPDGTIEAAEVAEEPGYTNQYVGIVVSPGTGPSTAKVAGTLNVMPYRISREQLAVPYMARYYRNSNQSISNNVNVAVGLSTMAFEKKPTGFTVWSNLDEERLVVPSNNKVFTVSAGVRWAAGTGTRRLRIMHHDGAVTSVVAEVEQTLSSSAALTQSVSAVWVASENDYFFAQVFQDSGGSLNLLSGDGHPYLSYTSN